MNIRSKLAYWLRPAAGITSAPIGTAGGNYSIIGAAPNTSLAYSAAWACVQLLTQDLAKLPLELWTGSDEDGWEPARLHRFAS